MANKIKIVLAIGGSSGSIYAYEFMKKIAVLNSIELHIVMSENAVINWQLEIGRFDKKDWPNFTFYQKNDFFAPFASGSAQFDGMVVLPCSMGLLARIASGTSEDLITRAADVMLKERRKLILVPRETPYNLIHIENMLRITQCGGIVCPASPSFYSKPQTIEDVVLTVVDRIIDLLKIQNNSYRWGENIS